MGAFEKTITMRMQHTDAAGILYFARLFDFAEDLMEDALEAHGFPAAEYVLSTRSEAPRYRSRRSPLCRQVVTWRYTRASENVPAGH